MDIGAIINYLNSKYNGKIRTDYYNKINVWECWWRGFYKPFHQYREVNGTYSRSRRLYSLKMGKKVCEDWASILLNEKTEIVVEDKAGNEYINGDDGVLETNNFWLRANELVEKAFYSGTGAIVLRVNNITADADGHVQPTDKTAITMDFLDASCIIPLSARNGIITECAFATEVMERGERYIYLEEHLFENGKYVIHNSYFSENDGGQLNVAKLPDGMAESFNTGSDIPWFAIIKPNIVNNIKGNNGLGISVYANAIDNLAGTDLAFNNLNRDFKLGGKKVFYNADMVKFDSEGNTITPDDISQQLFFQIGDGIADSENSVAEFNPSLRVQENKDGIQAELDYLSFKVGLGTKHYQFNSGTVVTATQYTGDKQDLVQNASKHYINIEKALRSMVKAILYIAKELMYVNVNPDTDVTVAFDDGYVIDKEQERTRDQQEVRDGLMQPYEFRMKWYGESEEDAKAILADSDVNLFGEGVE